MATELGLPSSERIQGLIWTSDLWTLPQPDVMGDTYPVTWTGAGEVLTSAGDPNYGPSYDGLDLSVLIGAPPIARLDQRNPMPTLTGSGGHGAKPSGIISTGERTYLAVQNTLGYRPPTWGRDAQHGSDASILRSEDAGRTWTSLPPNPHFPGARFGGPTFIQHGRGAENVRDGYVYAVSGDQWDNGCQLRLGRAPADEVDRPTAWTFLSATDPEPVWEPWLHAAEPILTRPRTLGLPEMVYLAALDRYLLLTWSFPDDFTTRFGGDLLILDAPAPWGPFSVVHYEREWLGRAVAPYCPRLPLAWMDPDGLGGWILTSGNFNPPADPARPFYKPNAVRFRLELR